jgi:hypothetical protein
MRRHVRPVTREDLSRIERMVRIVRPRAFEGKPGPLDVLRDLMLGGRHSRHTVRRFGVSLPTADRWLKELYGKIPGVRKVRDGKTTWFDWVRRETRTETRRPFVQCAELSTGKVQRTCVLEAGHRYAHRDPDGKGWR